MSLKLAIEIWASLKPLFATSDRPEAAEAFVDALIENDFDPKEIRKAFKKDGNIVTALGLHEEIEEEEEDYDDEDEDDEDY